MLLSTRDCELALTSTQSQQSWDWNERTLSSLIKRLDSERLCRKTGRMRWYLERMRMCEHVKKKKKKKKKKRKRKRKSETELTASVLKKDPKHTRD